MKRYLILLSVVLSLKMPANDSLREKIKSIPYKEYLYLENFFKDLVCADGLGYTLFFDKPVCLSGYFKSEPKGNKFVGESNPLFKFGWYAWKKNEHLFEHPNYIFIEEKLENPEIENYNRMTGENIELYSIFIINKRALFITLKNHLEVFKKELGEDFNPQTFINQLKEGKSFSELTHAHKGVLGILLGYGKESSMHYYARENAIQSNIPKDYLLVPIGKKNNSRINPLQFVGDPQAKEVREIVKNNLREQESLCKIYSKNNFFKVSVARLMSLD